MMSRAKPITDLVKAFARQDSSAELESYQDLPVVARLMVEVRSDGTRTLARGKLEDVTTGQQAAVEAHGTTPLALALGLARSMTLVPALARQGLRSLLGPRGSARSRDPTRP